MQTTSKLKQNVRANVFIVSSYYMLGSRKCNIIHTRLRQQCSPLGADLFRANIINDSSCPYGCPLEDDIHYLLEWPLYTNARMQLFINIKPYVVISIETLLFGSDNLTDETNLIVFTIVQHIYILLIDLDDLKLYSALRMVSYICIQSRVFLFFPTISVYQIYLCIHLLYMYISINFKKTRKFNRIFFTNCKVN